MPTNEQPRPLNVLILSIVPSPYQRDVFAAMDRHPGLRISVHYAQTNLRESPFAMGELRPYEKIHPNLPLQWRNYKFVLNWTFPPLDGVDVVVVNGYYTVLAQWALRRAAGRVPVILWAERMIGSAAGLRGFVFNRLTRPLANVDAIVAIGKEAGRDYARRYPGKPVDELPYLCDIDAFRKSLPARPRDPVTLLFCGQMIHRKGVDLLLQAFSRIIRAGLRARLLLVGWEADLPAMLSRVEPEVRAQVDYAGFQPADKLPEYFAQADVFVLPSRYDGWGVVVNQALGAGLPVVCSDAVGSAEDLVDPGRNGFVFKAGDVDQLAGCLMKLVGDPRAIAAFSARSVEMARELTPEHGARRWHEMLLRACGKGGPA